MASAMASLCSRAISAASSASEVSSGTTLACWVAAIAARAVAVSVSRHSHLYNSCCTRVGTSRFSAARCGAKVSARSESVIHSIQPQDPPAPSVTVFPVAVTVRFCAAGHAAQVADRGFWHHLNDVAHLDQFELLARLEIHGLAQRLGQG